MGDSRKPQEIAMQSALPDQPQVRNLLAAAVQQPCINFLDGRDPADSTSQDFGTSTTLMLALHLGSCLIAKFFGILTLYYFHLYLVIII